MKRIHNKSKQGTKKIDVPVDINELSRENCYKLGFRDGSDRLRLRLKGMAKTNSHLWEFLQHIDAVEPVNTIAVSVADAMKIIAILKKPGNSKHFAQKLEDLIFEHNSQKGRLYKQFCEEAKSLEDLI